MERYLSELFRNTQTHAYFDFLNAQNISAYTNVYSRCLGGPDTSNPKIHMPTLKNTLYLYPFGMDPYRDQPYTLNPKLSTLNPEA